MPKLNPIQRVDRLADRIKQLEQGVPLEARDINALLTPEQQLQLEAAWTEQQQIRLRFRTAKAAEQAGLVWKTKNQVRLEVYRQAHAQAEDELLDSVDDMIHKKEVRAARIFLDTFFAAKDAGKDGWTAANNALVRAGFRREGQRNPKLGLSKRDKEVRAMEKKILDDLKEKMTPAEREQYEMLEELEQGTSKRRTKSKAPS